jgi:hypothetical protein
LVALWAYKNLRAAPNINFCLAFLAAMRASQHYALWNLLDFFASHIANKNPLIFKCFGNHLD